MILRWMVTKTKTAVWGGYDRTKTTKSQYGLPVAYRKSTKFDLEYSSHQRKPLKKQSKTGYLKQGINILKRVLGAGESFFNNCRWVTYSNRYLNSEMNLSEYKRQGIHLTKCWVNHTEHWQKKKKKKKKKENWQLLWYWDSWYDGLPTQGHNLLLDFGNQETKASQTNTPLLRLYF